MKEYKIISYTFDELTPEAQRHAWECSDIDFSSDGSGEFRETLKAFERAFDISVYRWEVDDWTYSFGFVTAGTASDCPDGDALRVARFVWNNYAAEITKGKYYSTGGRWIDGKYHYKSRHSNVTVEMDNCPLTGVCYDYDILQPVLDCLHYKAFFKSFDELIEACLDNFFRAWRADIEYRASLEYFAEIAEINGWEFTENGEFFNGVA